MISGGGRSTQGTSVRTPRHALAKGGKGIRVEPAVIMGEQGGTRQSCRVGHEQLDIEPREAGGNACSNQGSQARVLC